MKLQSEIERTERAEEVERPTAQLASLGSVGSASSTGSLGSVGSAGSIGCVGSITPIPKNLDEVINSTLPTSTGRWFHSIFALARALKGIPDFADCELRELHSIVRLWHERAASFLGSMGFDDTWAAFVTAWPRVRFPKGTGPMADIIARANAASLPAVAERYDSAETRQLILLCRELQRAAGDGPFFLSCYTAGELIGVDNVTAWRRLKMLVADGVLATVELGTRVRATRYRYLAPLERTE